MSNFDSGENGQCEKFAPARRPWDNRQNPRLIWNENFEDRRLRVSQIEEQRLGRRFKPYTIRNEVPINTTPEQIFLVNKHTAIFRPPKPIQFDPQKRDQTKICELHNDHGYTTAECGSLRGKLVENV